MPSLFPKKFSDLRENFTPPSAQRSLPLPLLLHFHLTLWQTIPLCNHNSHKSPKETENWTSRRNVQKLVQSTDQFWGSQAVLWGPVLAPPEGSFWGVIRWEGQESSRSPHNWKAPFTESQRVCSSKYHLLSAYLALVTSGAQSKQSTTNAAQALLPQGWHPVGGVGEEDRW